MNSGNESHDRSFRDRVLNAVVENEGKGRAPRAPYTSQGQGWTRPDPKAQKQQEKKDNKYFNEQQKKMQEQEIDKENQELYAKEREEQRQSTEEYLQGSMRQIEEDRTRKIQELEDEKNLKIEKIQKGPPGFLKLFTPGFSLFSILMWIAIIIDGIIAISIGLIPGAGDAVSALWGFSIAAGIIIVFSIPLVLYLHDFGAVFKITAFFVFDSIIGMVAVVGDIIDAVGEFGVRAIKELRENFIPTFVVRKSYENRKQDIANKTAHRYDKKKWKVNDNAKAQIDNLKKFGKRESKFKTLKRIGGTGDLFFVFFMILTFFIGPLGTGLISLDFKPITVSVIVIYAVLLALLFRTDLVSHQKIYASIIFLVISLVADLMLQNSLMISGLFGNMGFIVYVLIGLAFILNVVWAFAPDKLVPTAMFMMLIILLFFLGPKIVSYAQSGSLEADFQENRAELEVGMKNANIFDQIRMAINRSRMEGNGTLVEKGDVERTSEYFGSDIESITPTRDSFYTGQTVALDIDTVANSFQPIGIMTMCKTDNIFADVTPKYTEVTDTKGARVRCSFDSLPKGTHVVDVEQTFRYVSSVKVPLKIMTEQKQDILLALAQDAGDEYKPDNYIKGEDTSISTSGPVIIRVGNMRKDNKEVLEMPIVVDRQNPNDNRRVNFKFQLDTSGDVQNSKIVQVNEVVIDLPSGVALENCDFKDYDGEIPPDKKEGDRWIYTFEKEFKTWDVFDMVSCDLHFDKQEIDKKFGSDGWFFDKVFFTIDYNYNVARSTTVKVIA
ncbi:MAG: hypothetical protein ACOCZV_01325 [Nanoarchaeota archaeon]